MRQPFVMEGSCPALNVNVEVLPLALPYCTIPSFTAATHIQYSAPSVYLPPDIAPPFDCLCFDVSMRPLLRMVNEAMSARMSGRWTQRSDDCCDPSYGLDLQLDVPCMPFDITSTGTLRMVQTASLSGFRIDTTFARIYEAPVYGLHGSMLDPGRCDLSFGVSMDIPCMPLVVSGTGTAILRAGISQPDMRVRISRLALTPDQDCAIDMAVSLDIPCMPLRVTGVGEIAMHRRAQPWMSVGFTRIADTDGECKLDLSMKFDLPCMPITFTGQMVVYDADKIGHTFRIVNRAGDNCSMDLQVSMDLDMFNFGIDCGDLSMDASARSIFFTKNFLGTPIRIPGVWLSAFKFSGTQAEKCGWHLIPHVTLRKPMRSFDIEIYGNCVTIAEGYIRYIGNKKWLCTSEDFCDIDGSCGFFVRVDLTNNTAAIEKVLGGGDSSFPDSNSSQWIFPLYSVEVVDGQIQLLNDWRDDIKIMSPIADFT